jgi:hypothetical protein
LRPAGWGVDAIGFIKGGVQMSWAWLWAKTSIDRINLAAAKSGQHRAWQLAVASAASVAALGATSAAADTPTAPTSLTQPPDPTSQAGKCWLEALARPAHIVGHYERYAEFAARFDISYSLSALDVGCGQLGRRSVDALAEHSYPLRAYHHYKVFHAYAVSDSIVSTDRARNVRATLHAKRECWPNPFSGDGDKKHRAIYRTTVIVTWKPAGGHAVRREVDTLPRKLCHWKGRI